MGFKIIKFLMGGIRKDAAHSLFIQTVMNNNSLKIRTSDKYEKIMSILCDIL